MKLSLFTLLTCVALATAGKGKTYLVTFPDDTPQSKVDAAASALENDGGIINHRYTLIKGFSVISDDEKMKTFQSSSFKSDSKYPATVEEDQIVHALGEDDK